MSDSSLQFPIGELRETAANDAPGYGYAKQARASTEKRADSSIAFTRFTSRHAVAHRHTCPPEPIAGEFCRHVRGIWNLFPGRSYGSIKPGAVSGGDGRRQRVERLS